MLQERQPRADYLELLKLTIIFLGGQPDGGVSFRQPGPVSSARWMSVALYTLRLALFRKQLSLSKQQADAILQVAIFVLRVYVHAWFTAPLAVSTPRNDLDLLKTLLGYNKVNKRVAKAATTRLVYHLWYLSEVMIGITVFDDTLFPKEKKLSRTCAAEMEQKTLRKRRMISSCTMCPKWHSVTLSQKTSGDFSQCWT